MKNRFLSLLLIFALSISLIACSSNDVAVKPDDKIGEDNVLDKKVDLIFEQSLSEVDAKLDSWGSMFYWSPDGAYAIINAFSSKPEASDSTAVILADIKNNKLVKLGDGYLRMGAAWSKDSKYAVFNVDEQLFLYNITEKTSEKIADKGYRAQFSPDNSKFIYMNEGLWIYDLASKSSTQITKGRYDSAPIWFSDGKRVFYFRDNGRNLGDGAGNEQVMSILDTSANKYIDVVTDIAMKGKFRSAEWVVEDQKLFIHAGWDDGNSYHLLDLENKKLIKDIAPADSYSYIFFDAINKKILMSDGNPSSGLVTAFDYDFKKLGTYSIDKDKEYPEASENVGITALKGNKIVYLHTNLQENKGALMISYLADGKQTRATDYGNYSIPFVSPDKELLAYFENNNKMKVLAVDNIKEIEVVRIESGKKAFNELLSMLPDRVGAHWIYNGFAEYGHSMRIDGINILAEDKKEYLISGKVDDMSDGESKMDFRINMKYEVSKDGIREIIEKGQVMPHKIKEFDVLRYPLKKGSTWTQQVEVNGQQTELKAEIVEESTNQENNRVLKVEYTARLSGMPNDMYKEVRTYEEGKGLVAFENTFDKDIYFGYSLYKFEK